MKRLSARAAFLGAVLALLALNAHAQQTISGPPEAGINEAIEIQVGGTPESGDMVRFANAEGEVIGGSYGYVGNAKEGRMTLAAPLEPGRYFIVYLSGGEVVARSPLRVNAVEASVDAPSQVGINETFEVGFQGPANSGDTLQVYRLDGTAVGGTYAYVGNADNNRLNLRAPGEPGNYQVVYLTGGQLIGSDPIEVLGAQAELSAPESVQAGAFFDVAWEGPDNSGDMLRVMDSAGEAAGSYGYLGQNPESVRLRAPEQPGSYSVVYLTGGQAIGSVDFEVVEITASLDAPAQAPGNEPFEVTWEAPGNYGDVIHLFPEGGENDVAYSFVNPEEPGLTRVHAPAEPGTHELRYTTQGGRTLATRAIEITPPVLKPGSLQVLASATPEFASGDAVEVVLDASGSMLQRQGDERRIDIAKKTLSHLLTETIPEGTPFAMRVFGHKELDSCRTDLEIVLGPLDRAAANDTLDNVNAMNLAKTPIADSLAMTESDLRGVTGERIIVLVTDGEETCEGDPAEVIAAMRAAGQDIRFNIVGYAIDDAGLQDTFARWATLGGGEYFNAADEEQLSDALTHSVAPSFVVTDADGSEVASGVAGGEPVSLLPGEYTVQVAGGSYPVTIETEKRRTLDLKTAE